MNLDTAVQGRGNAVEHGQRVALITRVFKPADNREWDGNRNAVDYLDKVLVRIFETPEVEIPNLGR